MHHVDLHLHLLPGVDDGPDDEAASLAHAERLARDGVHEATVTPHIGHPWFPLEIATIPERTQALQAALDAAGLDLRLHPGGEISPPAATSLGADDLDVIAHGPAGARWVLLEVPFAGIDEAYLAACAHIRDQGFGLLIGHPERAIEFLRRGHGCCGTSWPPARCCRSTCAHCSAARAPRRAPAPSSWSATATPTCSPPTATAATARTRSRTAPPPRARPASRSCAAAS